MNALLGGVFSGAKDAPGLMKEHDSLHSETKARQKPLRTPGLDEILCEKRPRFDVGLAGEAGKLRV